MGRYTLKPGNVNVYVDFREFVSIFLDLKMWYALVIIIVELKESSCNKTRSLRHVNILISNRKERNDMANISFQNVKKSYDKHNMVIPNLNLEINDCEFVVLVGPSGCGKSTTLRMIAGLEDVTEGDLYIGSKRVNDIAPKNRDIAMVFQNYALYPHMTVYKNMAFGLELRKVDKKTIDEKVRWAADVLDLTEYLNRKPKALSGGQRQRVALGRAMVRDPAVFLLDEPLSNLDAKLRTQMRTEITQLHKKLGTTFVYVTHDQTEAMTMGDRIAVMKDGVLQQFDTPQKLYSEPCNMFVAGFIGSPQMNFINAVVQKRRDIYYLCFGNNEVILPLYKYDSILDKYQNMEVVMGVRPEDFRVVDNISKTEENETINMNISISEMMGSEIFLYGTFTENEIIVRVPSSSKIYTDSSVNLVIDTDCIHLFDRETEQSIMCVN